MAHTVLIIDDSRTIRFITRVYLTGLDIEIREAADGLVGMAAIDAGGIDLVVADLRMPGVDGLQFVQQLRARPDPKLSRIPVILVTMESAPGLREQLIAAGANEYLVKPVTNAVFRATVLRFLPQAAAPRPEPPKAGS